MAEREGFEPSVEVSPHTRLAGERLQPARPSLRSSLAEEVGFEPTELSLNGFQDRRLQPLGHSSLLIRIYRSIRVNIGLISYPCFSVNIFLLYFQSGCCRFSRYIFVFICGFGAIRPVWMLVPGGFQPGKKTGFAEISGVDHWFCFFWVFQAAMYRLFLKDIFIKFKCA